MKRITLFLLFILSTIIATAQTADDYFNHGSNYFHQNRFDDAIRAYDEVIRRQPNNAAAFQNRAVAKLHKEMNLEAITDFNRAIRLSNSSVRAQFLGRATAFKRLKSWDRAIEDYGRMIWLNPKDYEAYEHRVELLALTGRNKEAIADLTVLIKKNATEDVAYTHVVRGEIYTKMGEYKKAIADFNRALRMEPELKEAYSGRAKVYFEKKDYKSSLAEFNRSLEISPTPENMYFRGLSKFHLQDLAGAINDFNIALKFDTDNPELYFAKALSEAAKGNYAEAYSDLSSALYLNSNYAEARFQRGRVNHALEKYENAISDMEKFLQLVPNSGEAYGQLGKSYLMLGRTNEALSSINKAIQLRPELPEPYMVRGVLNKDSKLYAEALEDLNQAIKIAPEFAAALYHRGVVQFRLNSKKGACKDLKKALKYGIVEAEAELKQMGCN